MKNYLVVLVIALAGGYLGVGIYTNLPIVNIANASKKGVSGPVITSGIKIVNEKGEDVAHLKCDETGGPELSLKYGIHNVTISHSAVSIISTGKDEYSYNIVGSSEIALGVNNGRDPLSFMKSAQRIELSAGRFGTIIPSISIWDSKPILRWSTP